MNQETKDTIALLVEKGETSKASIGRIYGVSPRTVGRYHENWKARQQQEDGSVVKENKHYSYVITPDIAFIVREEGGEITEVALTNPDDITFMLTAVKVAKDISEESVQRTLDDLFSQHHVQTYVEEVSQGRLSVDSEKHEVLVRGEGGMSSVSLSGRLYHRVKEALDNNEDIEHLIRFSQNLVHCHSSHVLNGLYDFLEASDIEINEDGHLICFKKVRDDYTDVFSGTFDNSVGKTVEVLPSECDVDPNRTCSKGLHCASWAYMKHYSGERIVKVVVEPKDVMSIPYDYYENDGVSVKAKMRTCKYIVIGEVK